MKYFIFLLLLISFCSCNDVSDKEIRKIEFLLGTDLNIPYEIKNLETPFDFADYYISFDLYFKENDFDSLFKKIDISKFENINKSPLDVQLKYGFYKELISEEENTSILMDTITNSLHYSSKR